jgi:diguanylate cyclase (GGDEF)-like protein
MPLNLFVLLPLVTAAAGAVGWIAASRRAAKKPPKQEDLATSSLVTETERRMLELVAKGAPLSEVLDTLTEAIERISPESLCTIMLLDEEHRRRLLIASGPSLPPAYLQAVNGLEIGPEVGACGTAAFTNETVIVEDIATDHRFAAARDFVLSHGLRSCWSQPIRDPRGSVLGTFATYRRVVSTPRPEELSLARVAGQLAGNAIERVRAEKQLKDAVKRLNLAEKVARFGIWEADFQKNIITLSGGLAALMERSPSKFQLTRAEFEAMVHPDDRNSLWSSAQQHNPLTETIQDEFRLVLPSGATRWMRSQWGFEQGPGPPTRATGAMIDVTNEKDLLVEAEHERAAAEATTRVARQAERLEQDRKIILELVANDQPLEQVAATMADAVASHLPGSLCAIRIEVPGDDRIALYPGLPQWLADALDRLALTSVSETLAAASIDKLSQDGDWAHTIEAAGTLTHRLYRAAPVTRDAQRVGVIVSLLSEDCADSQAQQKLLESWGRFASLAVERRGLYKQLSFKAQYDSLTSLLNRASLYERLGGLIRARGSSPLAVIYADLDSFKAINDTLGHGAGDIVLKHVASRLVSSVRGADVVARIGGDEFVIVLPGVLDRSEAARIVDLLAVAIATPVEIDGQKLIIGASFGISMCPIDGGDADALLKIADESMYKVKLTHRSRRASLAASQRMQALSDPAQDLCA